TCSCPSPPARPPSQLGTARSGRGGRRRARTQGSSLAVSAPWPIPRPRTPPSRRSSPLSLSLRLAQASPPERLREPLPVLPSTSRRPSHGTSPQYTQIPDCQYGFGNSPVAGSAPCRIRTCDLVLRRHPLWSTELRGRRAESNGSADYKDVGDRLGSQSKPATDHDLMAGDTGALANACSFYQPNESRTEGFACNFKLVPARIPRGLTVEVELNHALRQ